MILQIAGALAERGDSLEEVTSAADEAANSMGKRLLVFPHYQLHVMFMTSYFPQLLWARDGLPTVFQVTNPSILSAKVKKKQQLGVGVKVKNECL